MRHQKVFTTVREAISFANNCFHFQYERAYVELCIEGNVNKNSRLHIVRYFSNIYVPEAFTSQRFKQLTMSDKVVSECIPTPGVALLNTMCKAYLNGSKCSNCEMQENVNRGTNYVPLRHDQTMIICVSKWHYILRITANC